MPIDISTDFREIVKRSYYYKESTFAWDSQWLLLEELYNRNYLNSEEKDYNTLPKKIHQIWLGGSVPDAYMEWMNSWKKFNPDWEYILWTDDDIKDFDFSNRELFDSAINNGQKSDILRYEILRRYGGVYADTDFECLKPLNTLSYLSFFIGVGFPAKVELYIGLMGSVPHHPILNNTVDAMTKVRGKDWRDVFETTGTYFFTREFFKIVNGYTKGIVAFPHEYFYPFTNQPGHQGRRGRDYIKNCSYAIHHWAVSWNKF